MEKMIQIPEWQLKEIEDTLRLANNIHHSQRKETCFDRCVCKAWDFAKRALANAGTSEKDLRVCEVSGSLFSDSEILDWLQIAMSPNSNYCELYLAGLRNFESDYAQAFQIESCPEKFKTVNAPTLREAVSLAMIAYNDR